MIASSKVIDWLLEENNPPVRYLTLTRLLGESSTSAEVRRAKSRLMDYEVTQRILKHAQDLWGDDHEHAYRKYTGRYWQLIFLGHFLADGRDRRQVDGVKASIARRDWIMSFGGQCLTANLLAAFMRLGYADHPIVREETEALALRIVADGGLRCSAMAYSLLSRCFMAQPKLLLCFAQIPAGDRSQAVRAAIDLLVRNLLDHEVFVYVPGRLREWQDTLARQPKRADLPKGKTVLRWVEEQRESFLKERGLGEPRPKAGWLKFGFPLHYNSDTLEAMYALASVGVPMTAELEKPLEVIRQKRSADGTWRLENSLNGKMLVDVELKGKRSKWLTYFGCYILAHFTSPQSGRTGKGQLNDVDIKKRARIDR